MSKLSDSIKQAAALERALSSRNPAAPIGAILRQAERTETARALRAEARALADAVAHTAVPTMVHTAGDAVSIAVEGQSGARQYHKDTADRATAIVPCPELSALALEAKRAQALADLHSASARSMAIADRLDAKDAWRGEVHPTMVHFAPRSGVRSMADDPSAAREVARLTAHRDSSPRTCSPSLGVLLSEGHTGLETADKGELIRVCPAGGRGLAPRLAVSRVSRRSTRGKGRACK